MVLGASGNGASGAWSGLPDEAPTMAAEQKRVRAGLGFGPSPGPCAHWRGGWPLRRVLAKLTASSPTTKSLRPCGFAWATLPTLCPKRWKTLSTSDCPVGRVLLLIRISGRGWATTSINLQQASDGARVIADGQLHLHLALDRKHPDAVILAMLELHPDA